MAACIFAVSSISSPFGLSVAQIVDRDGMPPAPIMPGCQRVARSGARKLADAFPSAATARPGSQLIATAATTATAWMKDGRIVDVAIIQLPPHTRRAGQQSGSRNSCRYDTAAFMSPVEARLNINVGSIGTRSVRHDTC